MTIINEIIRRTMMDNRKTIADVANATGYSYQMISDVVLEDATLSFKEACRIMKYMNVDLEEVLR